MNKTTPLFLKNDDDNYDNEYKDTPDDDKYTTQQSFIPNVKINKGIHRYDIKDHRDSYNNEYELVNLNCREEIRH